MRFFRKASFKKYLTVFKISFQEEFAYRANFIMWRVRNVLQILLVFFLWDTVFASPGRVILGYTREKILTYVFLTIFVKALVFSARAIDIGSEIAKGDLMNYLLKPVSYFKYWFTRDVSSKVLNFIFAVVEFGLLAIILKPPIFLQTNPVLLFSFIVSVVIAIFIYFCLLLIISTIPFWLPEAAWGGHFLLIVVLEAMSGSLFPIDVLPTTLQKFLYLTPFPYLVFFPIQVYLGNFSTIFILQGFLISTFWAVALWLFLKNLWKKGILAYQAFGR